MTRRTAGSVLALVLAGFATAGAGTAAAGERLARLSLAQALDRLRAGGLELIYSTELVTPAMQVEGEPGGATPRERLEALLAPHGLAAVAGPRGVLLVVRAPAGVAVTARVAGSVRADDDGAPMAGVELRLDRGESAVWSGRDGRFAFDRVAAGEHTVTARAPGYLEAEAAVVVTAAQPVAPLELVLVPQPRFLQEVVVTPSRFGLIDERPESKLFLDRDEVQRLPHLTDDIFRVAQRLPGVTANDISAPFGVRGGGPDEVTVVLDGEELDDPFHLHGFHRLVSVIDSELVDDVEVLTGGFPVDWGDTLSAIVDVRSAVPDRSRRLLGAGGFNMRGLLQGVGNDGSGSWSVAARRGYLDWVFTWLDAIDESSDLVADPNYWDAYATWRRPVGRNGWLSAHLLGMRDQLTAFDDDDGERVRGTTSGWHAWSVLWNDLGGGLTVRSALSASHSERRLRGWSEPGRPSSLDVSDRRSSSRVGFKQDWLLEQWRGQLLKWGLEVRKVGGRFDLDADYSVRDPLFTGDGPPLEIARSAHMNPSGWQYAAYSADRFRIRPGLTLEAGVRWDRQTWTPGDDQISPRLNLVWETMNLGTVRVAWGQFAQSQAISELQVADGVNTFFPAEWAEHRVVSWERALRSGTLLRVELYHKRISDPRPRFENLIDPIDLFPEGEADRVVVAPEQAVARGLELLVKSRPSPRWSWWASASLSAAEDRIDGRWVPRSWDQRRALSWSVNWRPSRRWNLNVAGQYHSGWPRTPSSFTLLGRPDGSVQSVAELGERNSARHRAYSRIDLRISRTVAVRHGSLRLFFDVMNLTDRDNQRLPERASYRGQAGDYWLNWSDETWMPILPTFGLNWEF